MLSSLFAPRRKVFVSYHHGNDLAYYGEFSRTFAFDYETCQDNSVDREIDSDDAEYVIRRIREDYVTGSSCTIVLCGSQTPQRKFVDWEIKATLDAEHGLIGVALPTCLVNANRQYLVPHRLADNINSGYASLLHWQEIFVHSWILAEHIEAAPGRSNRLINNSRPLRRRNG